MSLLTGRSRLGVLPGYWSHRGSVQRVQDLVRLPQGHHTLVKAAATAGASRVKSGDHPHVRRTCQ